MPGESGCREVLPFTVLQLGLFKVNIAESWGQVISYKLIINTKMKHKKFEVMGATVLVLQKGDSVAFYMSIKTCRFFHCVTLKAKIEDITEEDAKNIWKRYYQIIKKQDDAWRAKLKKRSKSRKPRWKRKMSDSDGSEPVLREIGRQTPKSKHYV